MSHLACFSVDLEATQEARFRAPEGYLVGSKALQESKAMKLLCGTEGNSVSTNKGSYLTPNT